MSKSQSCAHTGAFDHVVYDGQSICRLGNLLNLTHMWHAMERPQNGHPHAWLKLPETRRLVQHFRDIPPATPTALLADIVGLSNIRHIDADFLLVRTNGRRRGLWAHWQIAFAYAQFLSPSFHAWCNQVVRGELDRLGDPSAAVLEPMAQYLEDHFARLHHRFDITDGHAGDLMFLVTAAQHLVLGNRRSFSGRTQAILREVLALPPFAGGCPCCGKTRVLSPGGSLIAGTQFDHFFHRGLNRPEHGWIICGRCHDDLSRGGYVFRFSKMPKFHAFQVAVVTFIQAHR